jgi:glucose/arabinose dehydrogenase/PKD repeat protein
MAVRRRWMPTALLAVLVLVATTLTVLAPPASAAVYPPGFNDQLVAAVPQPTAIAFTPDGRMLVTSKSGQLSVVARDGTVGVPPALDLGARVCANNERGLVGLAVDPDFAANSFIYLYWTFKKFGDCPTNRFLTDTPVNRVARYVLGADDRVVAGSETLLIDNVPSPSGFHNSGDLQFGKDGYLYVSIGEGQRQEEARNRGSLMGKIVRITRSGDVPPDNPFLGAGSARCALTGKTASGSCQEVFAYGLRNPFRMAFDPNAAGTRFHINDVGWNTWEEVNLGQAGADYGWNLREGGCVANISGSFDCGPPPAGMTDPIFAYQHDQCSAITGGAFVPAGVWPAGYDGAYLHADYACGKIFRLQRGAGGGYTSSVFASGLGLSSAVHMRFGPHNGSQALYFTTFRDGGQVRRITFTSGNVAPSAELTASPTTGDAPLTVSFDGSASSDPEGGALTYLWSFGDGRTSTTTTPTTTHTYAAGTYAASLRVRDPAGNVSSPASVTITSGNSAPTASITSPAAGFLFRVGQTITLSGSGTDPEDGALPPRSLFWMVQLHHNDHTHPVFSGAGNNLTFTAPAPEDFVSAQTSYLEVILTATDSSGVSTTVTRNIQPRRVRLTFASNPTGLNLRANGVTLRAPATVTAWHGWRIQIGAPSPQNGYVWRSWSDGGAQWHAIGVPSTNRTYTATYHRP